MQLMTAARLSVLALAISVSLMVNTGARAQEVNQAFPLQNRAGPHLAVCDEAVSMLDRFRLHAQIITMTQSSLNDYACDYALGTELMNREDAAQGLQYLRIAAGHGIAQAAYQLGFAYENDLIADDKYNIALSWYNKAKVMYVRNRLNQPDLLEAINSGIAGVQDEAANSQERYRNRVAQCKKGQAHRQLGAPDNSDLCWMN
jgi:hypothetical protein